MSEPLALFLKLALIVGIVLTVFTIGLSATWGEATALFKQPGRLVRSLVAMNVLAPVLACLTALAFDLHPAVRIALVAMAVSPVPPFLPKFSAGGEGPYGIGLVAVTSMLAVVFVPVVLVALQYVFAVRLAISPMEIALLVGVTVLVPLLLGLGVRAAAPSLVGRLMRPATLAASAFSLSIRWLCSSRPHPACGSSSATAHWSRC